MEIIKIQQNWADDLMRIDLSLGNYCNYKCWYCWPGSNEGTNKWPNFDIFVNNLSYLLDYYIAHTNKKKFDIQIMGGEITLWPRFFDLIKFFKTRYDCIFTLTTNGSRDLQFWEEAAECLDYVILSTHHQYANTTHLQQVGDLLYKKNVIVTAIVLMDPFAWDKCIKIVNDLQHSKYSWSIRYLEVIHKTIEYTVEQKKILNKLRARRANILWFLRNNKSYKSSVTVVDENNKKHKLGDQTLVIERMNNFKGWQCSLGVNWIAVKTDGTVSGICGNGLYKDSSKFNIFNENFIETFKPTIEHTICQTDVCWCIFETNMPKKRIIPIYAN